MEYTRKLCHNECYNEYHNDCYCQSECDVLEAIALEEAAIAHILNAEGEKIQLAVAQNATIEELLCINQSLCSTIVQITALEGVLLNKLEAVLNCRCCPKPPTTLCPPEPCLGKICVMINECNTCRPLNYVRVFIFKDNEFVGEGSTNCNGAFITPPLCCGCYIVKVIYGECCKSAEVNVECNQCVCVKTCFPTYNCR